MRIISSVSLAVILAAGDMRFGAPRSSPSRSTLPSQRIITVPRDVRDSSAHPPGDVVQFLQWADHQFTWEIHFLGEGEGFAELTWRRPMDLRAYLSGQLCFRILPDRVAHRLHVALGDETAGWVTLPVSRYRVWQQGGIGYYEMPLASFDRLGRGAGQNAVNWAQISQIRVLKDAGPPVKFRISGLRFGRPYNVPRGATPE